MRTHLILARRWMLALALIAAVALLAASSAGARNVKNGTVEGTVLDQAGKPVAGVTVIPYVWSWAGAEWWTWNEAGVRATTARSGSYKLALPPGTYRILFVPGDLRTYAIEAYPDMPAPDFGQSLYVTYGRAIRRISAILDPPAHIEGTVTDATTGDPVAGIHLQCIFQGDARIQGLPIAATVSGTSGHYEVWGLKPYPGFTLQPEDPTGAYWGPWYQHTGDFPPDQYYPAGVRYEDIEVERMDLVNLDGYVMLGDPNDPHDDPNDPSDDPTPISGAEVVLHEMWDEGGWDDEPDDPMRRTTTNASGYFSFSGLQLAGRSVLVSVTEVYPDYWGVWYSGDGAGWGAQDDGANPVDIQLGHTANLGIIVTGPCELTPPWEWN
jgi:hypothetical protein